MQQGNVKGTQYRSDIYYSAEDELELIIKTRDVYQQQYLAKNQNRYGGLGGADIHYSE